MNESVRKVCWANLLKTLGRLKQHADPEVVTQATMAEALFADFESSERQVSEVSSSVETQEYSDSKLGFSLWINVCDLPPIGLPLIN